MSLFRRELPDPEPFVAADRVREYKIAAARRCHAWTELAPEELVARERGYFVRAADDAAFRIYAGDAFTRSGHLVSDSTPLFFTVEGGRVYVFEKLPHSWSDLVYARERAAR